MTHRRSRAKASTLVRGPLPSSLSRRLPALVPPEHRRKSHLAYGSTSVYGQAFSTRPGRSSVHLRLPPRVRVRHVSPALCVVQVGGHHLAPPVVSHRVAPLTTELPGSADSPVLERIAARFALRRGSQAFCCLFGHFFSQTTGGVVGAAPSKKIGFWTTTIQE
jgi:hypothetical protein